MTCDLIDLETKPKPHPLDPTELAWKYWGHGYSPSGVKNGEMMADYDLAKVFNVIAKIAADTEITLEGRLALLDTIRSDAQMFRDIVVVEMDRRDKRKYDEESLDARLSENYRD